MAIMHYELCIMHYALCINLTPKFKGGIFPQNNILSFWHSVKKIPHSALIMNYALNLTTSRLRRTPPIHCVAGGELSLRFRVAAWQL